MIQVLLVILSLLFVFIVFGIGVAFGGGEQLSTGNTLNTFIALGTVLSALVSVGTLLVLIEFRHDWRMPKIDESRLDLIRGLNRWERAMKQNIDIPSKYNNVNLISPPINDEINDLIAIEETYWKDTESSFDTLLYYEPSLKELESDFVTIASFRNKTTSKINGFRNEVQNPNSYIFGLNTSTYTMEVNLQKRNLNNISNIKKSIIDRL
ncbi:hypothetical protein ACVD55_004640 [Vibrio alginolyticus]